MNLAQLISGLDMRVVRGDAATVDVRAVQEDSRRVEPRDVFVAKPGGRVDGTRFIAQACDAGAAAIVLPGATGAHVPDGPAVLESDAIEAHLGVLAQRAAGSPGDALSLIGVTGTNGKSTVAWIVRELLDGIGVRTGLIGTIQNEDGVSTTPSAMTTPPAVEIARSLAAMRAGSCEAVAMEVSSHALSQHRISGVTLDAAILTNVTADHLDYHGTMEAYAAAKASIMRHTAAGGLCLGNLDDAIIARMPGISAWSSLHDPSADWFGEIHDVSADGMTLRITSRARSATITLPLIGEHNAMNAMQAIAAVAFVADKNGWDASADRIADACASLRPPPGRLERVDTGRRGIRVIVDYAHTADALARTLGVLRSVTPRGSSLHAVFGCGGERDTTKRAPMGRIASTMADSAIITADNPRLEPIDAINHEILAGVPADAREKVRVIADRAEAIGTALREASPGDIVLIAGKGHETEQVLADETGECVVRVPFSDRVVARRTLDDMTGAEA